MAPDGAVWSTDGRRLLRTTSNGVEEFTIGTAEPVLTLVGNAAFVLDRTGARARFHDGDWVELPQDVPTSELVVQVQGPAADCAWLGADDDLWCIGRRGIDEHVTIDGLGIDGSDRLAITGDAAALIRQVPPAIVRIDWRDRRIYDDVVASVPASAELTVATNVDLVWVDDSAGDLVWSINPWGINAIRKNDASTPLLGESGEVIEDGSSTGASGPGDVRPGVDPTTNERQPDDNGIDDPPVAIDDPVTSRSGKAVPVVVTANDYDPDGEAIAVVEVGTAAHGTVDIANASTVVYQPEPGYVGLDRFDYTIVDGNGTEASAVVILELLPVDAPNQAPVARDDVAETGPDVGRRDRRAAQRRRPGARRVAGGVVHATRHRGHRSPRPSVRPGSPPCATNHRSGRPAGRRSPTVPSTRSRRPAILPPSASRSPSRRTRTVLRSCSPMPSGSGATHRRRSPCSPTTATLTAIRCSSR